MTIEPANPNKVLGWLDQVDDSLKGLTDYLDDVFEGIADCPQETVDWLCENASNKISYELDKAKVKILNGLGTQKKAMIEMIEKYGPLITLIEAMESPSIDNIVSVVTNMFKCFKLWYEIYIKPYEQAIKTMNEMVEKIISISNSMQSIANYTPPKGKDVNFNKFKIKFQPISIDDIDENGNLPYPDPPSYAKCPNPFTKIASSIAETKELHQKSDK